MIDLSPDRAPSELIDAIHAARSEDRRDLRSQVERLAHHSSPTVREEAAALLLVRWHCVDFRPEARRILIEDVDAGVRARVALGLAMISSGSERLADAQLLAEVFAAKESAPHLKCACFEGLRWMVGRPISVELDDTDVGAVNALVQEIAHR